MVSKNVPRPIGFDFPLTTACAALLGWLEVFAVVATVAVLASPLPLSIFATVAGSFSKFCQVTNVSKENCARVRWLRSTHLYASQNCDLGLNLPFLSNNLLDKVNIVTVFGSWSHLDSFSTFLLSLLHHLVSRSFLYDRTKPLTIWMLDQQYHNGSDYYLLTARRRWVQTELCQLNSLMPSSCQWWQHCR